jgi:hypothetical protein
MTDFIVNMPEWGQYLIRGIILCLMLCFSAVILGRAGRNPYWALLTIVPLPFFLPVLVWVFAFAAWPKRDAAAAKN